MEVNIIRDLIGKTLVKIDGSVGDDVLTFKTDSGESYQFFHYQSCCEDVKVEDIVGDISDLIGVPLLMAEEVIQIDMEASESGTWTFYKFATIKGYVTIRWYGSSNGYYSEGVSFEKVGA